MQKGVEDMEERILSEVIPLGLLLVMSKRHFMINSEVFLIINEKYSIAGIVSRSSDMISWEERVSDSLQGLDWISARISDFTSKGETSIRDVNSP